MSWDCACGISNNDNDGVCSGCGWSREKSNAYKRGEIPASSLETAAIVARQDLTVKLGIGGALLGGLVGYLLRPSIFLIGKLPFFTVITRGASLSGFEQILVPVAQESFNIMFIGVIIGSVGGLILSSIVSKTSTYSTGATEAIQSTAPSVPAGPQTQPRSDGWIADRIADPQLAAKYQAYRIRLQKEPGNIAVLGEYGDFLARAGNVDEALVQYFTIVELQPEDISTRRKIVALFKQQNNIPKATEQLLQILHIRPDDIEAQEDLGRLNSAISDDKLRSSSSSQQGQIFGPDPVQEPNKSKENKKDPRLLIVGGIAAVVLIALAVVFLQKPSSLSPPPPPPPPPVSVEATRTKSSPIADKYIGTWEYDVDGEKNYLKITKDKSDRFKFERGWKWEGNIVYNDIMLKDTDAIYLKVSDGKMIAEFVSGNFYPTHGMDFIYKITLDIKSDNKLFYAVYSENRGEPDEQREANKLSY